MSNAFCTVFLMTAVFAFGVVIGMIINSKLNKDRFYDDL